MEDRIEEYLEDVKARVASGCGACGKKWRTRARDDIRNPPSECKECGSTKTVIIQNPEEHEEFIDHRTRIQVR